MSSCGAGVAARGCPGESVILPEPIAGPGTGDDALPLLAHAALRMF